MHRVFKKLFAAINPDQNPNLKTAADEWENHLPTIWLLGKTGAGKSSLIHHLTGVPDIEIGNGFRPCTLTASSYDYPPGKPLVRFLDTRGLAEADYDPGDDLAACEGHSHLLLLVVRLDDPEQSAVEAAFKRIRSAGRLEHVLLVHTAMLAAGKGWQQTRDYNQARLEKAWGQPLASVEVDTAPETGEPVGLEALRESLQALLPMVAALVESQTHQSLEEANFASLKQEVLWYAGMAAGSDLAPAIGLVSVPAIQGKMLHSLANQYGMTWNRQAFAEFAGALGGGFALQYASHLGIRQLVKLIPAYGQTVGSASAAAVSFSTTYALGRVAAKYLYHKGKGESVSQADLKALYGEALKVIKEAVGRE